jgi:hypothetical protein
MALFNDGPISAAADLQGYENAILNVAGAESIDIAAKILLAQQDLANDVLLFLLRRPAIGDCSSGFRRTRGVTDVVVTDALRQWHVHKALALVYRDAYNNQLNDRYQGKWKEYEQLARTSSKTYFQIGVGLVADPIPKAAAPVLSSVVGEAAGATFFVAATWVNAAGQEGAPSDINPFSTADGQLLVVAVSDAPQNATGWNAYIGTSPDTVTLQNASPLATEASWTTIPSLDQGAPLPMGQQPTWFIADHRVIERG